MQQIWFAGVHSDVGGGYKNTGFRISPGPDDEGGWPVGLVFRGVSKLAAIPDPAGLLHESHVGLTKLFARRA